MRTPAGKECRYYYEDFARGATRQECRITKKPGGLKWIPADCGRCAVPDILVANSSPALDLRIWIHRARVGKRRVDVEAWCAEHGPVIEDPYAGCPVCNEAADELLRDAFK